MRIKSIDTLYHGSDKEFEKFDLSYANAFKDYGKGFYLTSSYQQAQKWAQQKGKNKPTTTLLFQIMKELRIEVDTMRRKR